ncbi:MAG: hypothetical protein HY074_02075 [Deltaproteobacteria bacterium]|nr:hypothetical protein [Deltaproteobacteria bacterium]
MRTFFAVAIVTATLLIPQLCLANDPQLVFNVTREGKKTVTPVKVTTDENGDLTGLLVDKDPYSATKLHGEAQIHIDGVKDSDKVLFLNGAGVNPKSGGNLTMRYLHDGVKGTYYSLTLNLSRNVKNGPDGVPAPSNDDTWTVKVNGKVIKALYMKNNDVFLLGTIGIETINPAYAMYADSRKDAQALALGGDAGFSPEKVSDSEAVKLVNTAPDSADGGTQRPAESGKISVGT